MHNIKDIFIPRRILVWLGVVGLVIMGLVAYVYGWIQLPSNPYDPYVGHCSWVDDPKTIRLPNGKAIIIDLADTVEERTQGLSDRVELANNGGMLFIFDDDNGHPMWMKDMLFNLDMIWLDQTYRIVHWEQNVSAPSLDGAGTSLQIYQSSVPARYVLEVASGTIATHKLAIGDQLKVNRTKRCLNYFINQLDG